ncbi:MAG: nitrogen regulation protein NR(II) [Gammaproteobacteria bacterium]|nr:nitrogen regulation protein NR(II) [Gammaproteobacteria bacterium]
MARDNLDPTVHSRRILENLNAAVVLFDAQLQLLYMNPAAEMLFALSTRRAAGTPADRLLGGESELLTNLHQALDSGHPFTERELTLHLPLERTITVDCTVTPIIDGQERSLLVEITQLDRQLRIAREEQLLAQNETTRDVIRGLAHEIKNPLGGLRGAAQLLERELPNAQLKEYTGIIIGEADRLQKLINRMLGPHTLPHKQWTNIHELLERVRQLVQAEAPTGITLKRDYDPSLPDIYADPDQLIQAVLNLVRNAVEAMDERGEIILRTRIQRQFTIGNQRHRLVACIEVIDNGPGIPAEMLDKIFFPMVTGRVGGTGLGLTIAQNLISQHGGLIECVSQPGKTVFTILLPLELRHE